MLITAWTLRKRTHRAQVVCSVRNALEAANALNEQDIDIVQIVSSIVKRLSSSTDDAILLSNVASVLTEAGWAEEGLVLYQKALDVARYTGRESTMEVLADGAMILASVDNGDLLLKLHQELESIDNWFKE